ncbi:MULTISPECIES: hypothetical protein [Streptococcus]|nr:MULTISPECIES: hypothetical protein [Streptococcus]EGS27638.1 hypothetical protein FSLSAGS3026_06450 [Streptococcus agalactiae FSL S3-026]EPT35097.1 hypothetical protein SAG0021_01555 [Streptococcus agalactiae FSL S3-277]EPV88110.1 hypothetical protein SAG0023_02835 [Streptococcus agalactiae FSL S3-105]EPV89394.1 hypothetical protein SAG0014_09795 [Streptococcus agalactiae FSL S3-586]MCQ9275884.1 hypothetical protein [Streptococcus suis]
MENIKNCQDQEDLTDTLIAISVISKLLARKIMEEESNEQNERTE